MHIDTDECRIPQNVIATGRAYTSLNRTLRYTIKPIPDGKLYLLKFLSSISSFTKNILIQTFIIQLICHTLQIITFTKFWPLSQTIPESSLNLK